MSSDLIYLFFQLLKKRIDKEQIKDEENIININYKNKFGDENYKTNKIQTNAQNHLDTYDGCKELSYPHQNSEPNQLYFNHNDSRKKNVDFHGQQTPCFDYKLDYNNHVFTADYDCNFTLIN